MLRKGNPYIILLNDIETSSIAKAFLILPGAHKGSHVPMLELIYNELQSFCISVSPIIYLALFSVSLSSLSSALDMTSKKISITSIVNPIEYIQ